MLPFLLVLLLPVQDAASRPRVLPTPTRPQAAWHDLEIGMFVHLAPQTWQDRETDDLSTPLHAMDPKDLDTEQWLDVAASMGARYLVFVAKHEGGFCWWQTGTTDFSVQHTPWRGGKGDVLADLARSCQARGVGLGVYLSPQDRKHGIGIGGKAKDPAQQKTYEQLFRQQLTEVLTRYGRMMEVWFDGSLVFDVGDLVSKHAPDAVVFQGPKATIRWVGNEDGFAPYPAWNTVRSGRKAWGHYTAADGDPEGDRWLPNECDARIRATWFWQTGNEKTLKSVAQLMDMYYRSVGHGAVLLLNHTPDRSGRIPAADSRRAAEFGAEIRRRFGTAAAETSGQGTELTVKPPSPLPVAHVVLAEDITRGERVRSYLLEGLVDGAWQALGRGSAIGHKRIHRLEPAPVLAAVRLRVLEAAAEPQIRSLALYR